MLKFLIVAVLVLIPSISYSCQYDIDCSFGSKCVKSRHQMYGVCVGGFNPGNSNDRKPARFTRDMDGTYGNTCQFNTDCGIRNKCYKSSGRLYGICM